MNAKLIKRVFDNCIGCGDFCIREDELHGSGVPGCISNYQNCDSIKNLKYK